jgi:hypothetical protein
MGLESIISGTITSGTLTGTAKSFKIGMVFGHHNAYSDAARVYTTATALDQLITDGIPATDPIYRGVASMVSAPTGKPDKIVVGKQNGTFTQAGEIQVIGTPYTGQVYSFVVRNPSGVPTTISHTVTIGQTTTDIATALNALLTAVSGITSTSATDTISWDSDSDNVMWTFESMNKLQFQFLDATPAPTDITLATDLAAVRGANRLWYMFTWAGPTSAAINLANGNWAESYELMYLGTSYNNDEEDPASTVSASYLCEAANLFRTAILFSGDQTKNLAAAVIGKMLPYDPGSATFNFKTVSVTADSVSGNAETAFEQNNCMYYAALEGGFDWVLNTKTSGGEWVDVIVFRDWLFARIREAVATLLGNAPKIPYTRGGEEMIAKEMRSVLRLGVTRGGLDDTEEAPAVTYPEIADILQADRIDRILPDIAFSGRLAGAIHAIRFTGILRV